MDGLISRRHLSLDLALSLLTGVREEAKARDRSLAVAVVDGAGQVLASQRMDGAALGAMQSSSARSGRAKGRRRRTRSASRPQQAGSASTS